MFFAEFENMYLSGPRMWSKLILGWNGSPWAHNQLG